MNSRLKFSKHALERRFERGITREEVRQVLEEGEVIREYPSDNPLPSYLVLGWTEANSGQRPVHVVAADDDDRDTTYVITVYEPDPDIWTSSFREKKSNDDG